MEKEREKQLYQKFNEKLEELREIGNMLKPENREECFDRWYIDDYVERNKSYIRGDVLEFAGGDVIYSKKYGNNPNVQIMTYVGHKDVYPDSDYFADIEDAETLPQKKFDCIVATQVIMYAKNLIVTLNNLKSMLKPGGVLILTVPGPLFHHSRNSHHMFSFTEESLKYLCEEVFGNWEDFQFYGNLEYLLYMIFWMKKNPYEKPQNHEYLYTLVMGITVKKEN